MTAIEVEYRRGRDTDFPYIANSYLRTARDTPAFAHVPNEAWFTLGKALLEKSLERSDVTIAHPPGEVDIILGYLISEPSCIHWMQVKRKFQRLGIGRGLLAHAGIVAHEAVYTHFLPRLAGTFPHVNYNPFLWA